MRRTFSRTVFECLLRRFFKYKTRRRDRIYEIVCRCVCTRVNLQYRFADKGPIALVVQLPFITHKRRSMFLQIPAILAAYKQRWHLNSRISL